MDCPYFTVVRFDSFRINSDPNLKCFDPIAEQANLTSAYEFEFYTEDCDGGLMADGVLYPARKDYFTCCKPGHMRKLTLPYRCYFFNIITENPDLRKALDKLPIYAYCPESAAILDICREMVTIQDGNSLHARLLLESCICRILSILLRQEYAVPDYNEANVRKHQDILLAADRYLQEHLQEPVNLKQLSKGSGLHPTYFHKLFTAAFKRSPAEQLMWYRITAATQMLTGDNRPIAEIAELCGFSSQNYFSYKFKELCGESPSKYRRERRQHNPLRGA